MSNLTDRELNKVNSQILEIFPSFGRRMLSGVRMLIPPGYPELSEAERTLASTYVLRPCPSSVRYLLRAEMWSGGAEQSSKASFKRRARDLSLDREKE
ncbi:hypothetical protein PAXRUDRAFT_21506 [Paxillus rubicundulus Ve08.2h10]|uniref:Uncharacterized protein n=1 Tax=Paxillus rubicundulus Ve08.2h10 TaxID=930991 RepID=A0A0D0CPW4_9AGAM|nr:hypothetical protein PAXRUDRAFT_21506 [Paxillus rubicundulus Ve08.2h10]